MVRKHALEEGFNMKKKKKKREERKGPAAMSAELAPGESQETRDP